MARLKSLTTKINLALLALCMAVVVAIPAGIAFAAANNTLPKANIVQDNGSVNAKGFSSDPQIASCIFGSSGATAATTSFTVFASATEFPCSVTRGAIVDVDASGYLTIARSGVYRVQAICNGTGTNGNTMTQDAAISTDGGSTFATINGSQSVGVALTADLLDNMSGVGYVTVTSGQAASGLTVIAMRGKNSANTTTCAAGGGLYVERVDQLQPAQYP